jgi:hypothetical protein
MGGYFRLELCVFEGRGREEEEERREEERRGEERRERDKGQILHDYNLSMHDMS